jgi:hypothetical protein
LTGYASEIERSLCGVGQPLAYLDVARRAGDPEQPPPDEAGRHRAAVPEDGPADIDVPEDRRPAEQGGATQTDGGYRGAGVGRTLTLPER